MILDQKTQADAQENQNGTRRDFVDDTKSLLLRKQSFKEKQSLGKK